jgi:hypothetical protein
MVTIPIRALPSYVSEVTLENVAYRFVFKWNTRGEYYTIDIETAEGELLVAGLKMALKAALLRRHPGRGLPPGEIVVIDPSGSNAAIAFDDPEERISLVYVTEAEYAAL